MREFDTGATREDEEGKIDYEGHLSPLALEAFGSYMNDHRKQADGKMRSSDNWQKGFPIDVYMKSMWRHFMQLWTLHRSQHHPRGLAGDYDHRTYKIEALCAIMFNVQGYLHELIKEEMDYDGNEVAKRCVVQWHDRQRLQVRDGVESGLVLGSRFWVLGALSWAEFRGGGL